MAPPPPLGPPPRQRLCGGRGPRDLGVFRVFEVAFQFHKRGCEI